MAASTRDGVNPEAVPDLDLAPRIEALKAFLAKYPSEPATDRPPTASPPAQSETSADQPPPPAPVAPLTLFPSRRWRIAASLMLMIGVAVLAYARLRPLPSTGAETMGILTIGTNPSGVPVLIDGAPRGVTPLSVGLPPGSHEVELITNTEHRRIPVNITAGGEVSQFLEFPRTPATGGELMVRTDPPRVSVSVDGKSVGLSPVTIPDLTPGVHTVVLQRDSETVTERVVIESGRTASLVVSMGGGTSTANAAGWITISAPAAVQVFENGRLLGNSTFDRIMLPVGSHQLELVNEALGYRATHSVQVSPGQVAAVRPRWPTGTLALNAIPWAEVLIDGQSVGETPIGNVSVPIGEHEITFRHPELGEHRVPVTVVAGKPTTVGIDLRQK